MPSPSKPIQLPLAVNLDGRIDIDSTHASVGALGITATSYILNGVVSKSSNGETLYVERRHGYDVDYIANAAVTTSVKGFINISVLGHHAIIVGTAGNDYLEYNSIAYDLTVDSGSVGYYSLSYIESGGKNYIFIVGSVTSTAKAGYAWLFEPATTTLTRLVVGTHGFPDTTEYMALGAVSLDTYGFVLTRSGRIYNSNVGDILTWTSTDFIDTDDAESESLYLAKHHDHVVACSTQDIKFYYDAGNPQGSPLSLRKDITIPIGITSSRTAATTSFSWTFAVTSDNEYLAFVGANDYIDSTDTIMSSVTGVYLLDNFKLKKISTPFVDTIISAIYSVPGAPRVMLHTAHDRKFIVLRISTLTDPSVGDLVYDIATGYWYMWSIGTSTDFGFVFTSGEFGIESNTGAVSKSNTKYLRDENYDAGSGVLTLDYPYTIQIPQVSLGTSNNKFCKSTGLLGDYTPAQSDVEISWTDDNYQNFSTARNYDLQYHRKLTRCGMFRKRAWKIHQDTDNTGVGKPVRLSHIEIDVDGATVNTAD